MQISTKIFANNKNVTRKIATNPNPDSNLNHIPRGDCVGGAILWGQFSGHHKN